MFALHRNVPSTDNDEKEIGPMRVAVALSIDTSPVDGTFFGAIAVFRGSTLADAICHLRRLGRDGLRSSAEIDGEIAALIDKSKNEENP